MHAISPIHLILLKLIVLITFCWKYTLWRR
jgi:hypothetical protein